MKTSYRLSSIDIARGLVMIIMAIDHIRDLLHIDALTQDPLNFQTTTPALFLTRWITHLCAPTFVFLSGVSVFLSTARAGDNKKASAFLLKRGIWLVILEFTLINFALWFDIHFRILLQQVIAAIGFGLIVLSFLLNVSPKKIAVAALVIICLHNLLPLAGLPSNPALRTIVNIFFSPALIQATPDFIYFVGYPLIPWLGLMLLGYACGRMFRESEEVQRKRFIRIGIASLLAFVVLRIINVYGDPAPWATQKNSLFTFFSFINVTKYPPSLMYTLVFLGLMFVFLAIAGKLPGRVRSVLEVYGRVPMFYYLLHWYLIRLAVFIMSFAQGYSFSQLRFGPFQFGRPEGGGLPLGGVYLVWFAIVILLYPLCKWYGAYKLKHPEKTWLRYI